MNIHQGSKSIRDFIREIDETFIRIHGRGGRGAPRNYSVMRRQVKKNCLFNGMRGEIYEQLRDDIKSQNQDFLWSEVTEAAQDAEWLWSLYHREKNYVGCQTPYYNGQNFKVDDKGFVIVYTDGACLGNGQPDAVAGLGVWFGRNHYFNVSEPVYNVYPATNNVAEIRAVIRALEIVKKYGVRRLAVHTDSMYLIDSVTNWIFNWLSNDWQRYDGQPLKHKHEYRDLLFAMEGMDVKWVHVYGHSNNEGNIMADQLARDGAHNSIEYSDYSDDQMSGSSYSSSYSYY